MVTRENEPIEHTAAWTARRRHVTARHGGRDKDNSFPYRRAPGGIARRVDDNAHRTTNAVRQITGISGYVSAVFACQMDTLLTYLTPRGDTSAASVL